MFLVYLSQSFLNLNVFLNHSGSQSFRLGRITEGFIYT